MILDFLFFILNFLPFASAWALLVNRCIKARAWSSIQATIHESSHFSINGQVDFCIFGNIQVRHMYHTSWKHYSVFCTAIKNKSASTSPWRTNLRNRYLPSKIPCLKPPIVVYCFARCAWILLHPHTKRKTKNKKKTPKKFYIRGTNTHVKQNEKNHENRLRPPTHQTKIHQLHNKCKVHKLESKIFSSQISKPSHTSFHCSIL